MQKKGIRDIDGNPPRGELVFAWKQKLVSQSVIRARIRLLFILSFLLFISANSYAQTLIWSEDFNSSNDNATTGQGSPAITTWTTTNGMEVYVGSGLSVMLGYGLDATAAWTTGAIPIANFTNVAVSIDLTEGDDGNGTNKNNDDFIRCEYSYDGVTWNIFSEIYDDFTSQAATVSSLNGTELYLRIQMKNNSENNGKVEYHYFDNVVVQGTFLGPSNPISLSAIAASKSEIGLGWGANSNSDNVLLAVSADGTFGTPANGVTYSSGDPIPGGGSVLYYGSALAFDHTSLSEGTKYYYKAWSYDGSQYSFGVSDNATTFLCDAISTLPFTEDFSGGDLPSCWQSVDNVGNGQVWEFDNPGGRTISTTTAGNGFAILDSDEYGVSNSQDADLVSPIFDFTNYLDVTLSFEHYFLDWTGSSVTLFYSIDGGITWNDIETWTSETLNAEDFNQNIPEVAGQSNVSFKWNYTGTWGYYWAIDDIQITGTSGCSATTYDVYGGGAYCEGASGINVGIIDSEIGVSYQLYRDGTTAIGLPELGDNSAISFGNQTVAGTYTVIGHHASGNCDVAMNGSAVVSVNPLPTLGTATLSNAVCEGFPATINLTGLVLNSTFSLDYSIGGVAQPTVNGLGADASGGASFTTGNLLESDNGEILQITAVTITASGCSANFTEEVTLEVLPTAVDVSISASPTGEICEGTSVTYTATPANGGTNPSYQWKVNGTNVGANSNVYSYTPENGDEISCVLTSNSSCATSSASVPILFFSWNDDTKQIIDSDFGLDAVSVDSEAQYKSGTLAPGPTSSGTQGINLTFSGTEPELNFEGLEYSVDYRRGEGQAEMFTRGSYLVITSGSSFSVSYRVSDGAGSFTTVSSGNVYAIPDDDNFHNYRFLYNPQDGIGRLTVDGDEKWQSSPTVGQPLYWDGATVDNLLVGKYVDASGSEVPTFDNLSIKAINEKTAADSIVAVVGDNTPPGITCPAGITVSADAGNCFASSVILGTPTTSDNCGVASVNNNAPSTFPLGGTTVTWTVTDNSGNTASCDQIVTVEDNEDPVIPTLENITGECSATATVPTTTDICAGTITGTTTDALTYSSQGTHIITWNFDDGNGNDIDVTQNVIIDDITDPIISCFTDTTVLATPGLCGADITLPEILATDNCAGSVTVTNSFNSDGAIISDEFPIGTTQVVYTATDVAGNSNSCSVNVTVLKENNLDFFAYFTRSASLITEGESIVFNGYGSHQPETYEWIFVGGTPATSTSQDPTVTYGAAGIYDVTLKITDACSAEKTFTRSIQVTENPVFTSSVSNTFVVPSCVTEITVEAWGAGGAGGGSTNASGFQGRGGAGGGGGAYAKSTIPVISGTTLNLIVGAGGTGGIGVNGSDGGYSTIAGFESSIFAAGGKGGAANVAGGQPAGGMGGSLADSEGGVEAGQDGENGDTGFLINSGAGGDGANGGAGGLSLGGWTTANGNPGFFEGGGGGGARTSATGGTQAGGSGANGAIIITYVENDPPTDPTSAWANPSTSCVGGVATLYASYDEKYELVWFENDCLSGNVVGTGSGLDVTPSVTTSYYARTYDPSTTCYSASCEEVVVSVITPTVTLGAMPSVCVNVGVAYVPILASTDNPNLYNIDYDAAANAAGFQDVNGWGIEDPTQIPMIIPNGGWGVPPGIYNGVLTVNTSSPVCESEEYPISVTITTNGEITTEVSVSENPVCEGTPVTFTASAVGATDFRWTVNGVLVVDSTSSTYTYNPINGDEVIGVAVIVCKQARVETQNTHTMTVTPVPTAIISGDASVCEGENVSISIDFTGTSPWDLTIQRDGTNDNSITGITDNPYSLDVSDAGVYTISAFSDNVCDGTTSGSATITVESTPVAGTLTKTPDLGSVCDGDNVSAILTAGSGGNGTDELEYSIDGGSNWLVYTSGTNISTTGLNEVQIRTRRMANHCTPTAYETASWSINSSTEIILDQSSAGVCLGDNEAVFGYTSVAGSPDKYNIDFDTDAETAGFVDVVDANLTGGSITVTVPESATPATYNAVLSVNNSATGCTSVNYSISIVINPLPATGEIIPD